jgi:hypothetical protein
LRNRDRSETKAEIEAVKAEIKKGINIKEKRKEEK